MTVGVLATKVVCAASLTMRSTPGGGVLGTLKNGDRVTTIQNSGSWTLVYSPRLGLRGWVLRAYLC